MPETDEKVTGSDVIDALASLVGHESALSKAEGNDGDLDELQRLAKANGEEGDKKDKKEKMDEDEDDYKPEYMRKHMKKYLKDNSDEAQKFMKELGTFHKAVTDIDDDTIIDEHEATVIDGTDIFKAFAGFADALIKAQAAQNERLERIEDAIAFNNELSKASGSVLADAARTVESIGSIPNPLRGRFSANIPLGEGTPLAKAQKLGQPKVMTLLMKAAREGNEKAIEAVPFVEISGGDYSRLPENHRAVIEQVVAEA